MKLACILPMLKNVKPIEYGLNTIHNLPTGQQKEIGYISDNGWKWLRVHFSNF